MKVLFIDDEAMILELLEDAIDGIDGKMVFAECHSLAKAMETIQRERPDIIFSDHNLTGNGGEGLKIVEALSGSGIRIISMTADPEIGEAYRMMGIEYIGKQNTEKMKQVVEAAFAAASDG